MRSDITLKTRRFFSEFSQVLINLSRLIKDELFKAGFNGGSFTGWFEA